MLNLSNLLGHGEDLTPVQMSLRAVIIFIVTLVLIRIGGVRIFGRRSSLDTIIVIVMGSVLARAIVGASPLLSTIAAATVMIITHRLFSRWCHSSERFEQLVKGKKTVLFTKGGINNLNLKKMGLTRSDLLESARLETKSESFNEIDSAFLETNGRISFISKKNDQ
jgi:uncharacterized membrane protein YcaP (DUF421 family)